MLDGSITIRVRVQVRIQWFLSESESKKYGPEPDLSPGPNSSPTTLILCTECTWCGRIITYMQQVEVGMQETLERGGILQLKYLRLQQVDKTKHMHVERHVISQSHLAEREAGSTLQQRAQHRQLPANTIICNLFISDRNRTASTSVK